MIGQRMLHRDAVKVVDSGGNAVRHTPELVSKLFDEELRRILRELPSDVDDKAIEKYRRARRMSEEMIVRGEFDPV